MARRFATVENHHPGTKPRTLVLCFDGTTNVYGDTNTNVVKLFSLLKRDRQDEQMVYYQPGIGTYTPPGILLPVTMALAKIADQGAALYLDKHVMGGYQFLVKHYNQGDRICLFGFSRGAYTARALAGMLRKVGLLPPDNIEQISFAYQMYRRTDLAGFQQSAGFRKAFSRKVNIEFMGVWDTVSSVGLLWPRHLPFTSSNTIVKNFRHAVSLDEHRAKFKQNVWHVRSHNAYCDPDQGSPTAKQPDLELALLSQTHSPVATPRFPTAVTESDAKQDDPNIITTNVTPPPLSQPPSPDDAPSSSQPLCFSQVQTNLRNFPPVQSSGVGKKNQEGPVGESWHSREPTQVQPNSGVDDLDIKTIAARGEASEQASQALHTIKSDSSLASGLQSGAGVTVSTGVANETKNKDKDETDVLEVWFAGCHSDVGGGAEPNDAEYSLSNISLRWMVRQIILSQCGIQFNNEALRDMKIPLPTLNSGEINPTVHDISAADAKMIEEAQDQERRDALAPLHDTLHNPLWWPLEFFPMAYYYQNETGDWRRSFRCNFFGPRHVLKTLKVVKIHRSVQYRIDNMENETGAPYKPRAIIDGFEKGHIEWVD